MKKKVLSFLLTVAMVLTLLVAVPVTATADTYDASANPVIITTDADMAAFQSAVNGGNSFSGKTVKLAGDVALNGRIGTTSSKPFSGNFDGQGHTVTITQTISNPDGNGGLFDFVRTPASGTVTIQNVHVTGTITMTGSGEKGYTGGLISAVDGNTSGSGGTINIYNCRSSVAISAKDGFCPYYIGGLVGFFRHATTPVKPLTLNIDSCLWDGSISGSPMVYYSGGFIGWTGKNQANGRTLNISITNSVSAGQIYMYNNWGCTDGVLFGKAQGSNNSSASYAVTVNISDVLSIGKINNSTNYNDSANIGHVGMIDGIAVLNMTNLYYNAFDCKNLGSAPALANGTANSATNVVAKDKSGFLALTGSDFSDASKWTFEDDCYPCPKGIYDTFGDIPACLVAGETVRIGSDEEMAAFQAAVNGGNTYEGKIVKLTADVALTGRIGTTSSKPFMGSFDGQGHTVTITQSISNPDGNGGLFDFVRTPAGGEVTIQNVHVTGTINLTNAKANNGWVGAVISCVDGNTSGTGGTINVKNVWSSVRIDCLGTECYQGVGGIIGVSRHADGLPPLRINMDSCLWDGVINAGPALYYGGGLMGYTGNNKTGRTLTINITNCVAAGTIMTNSDWNVSNGVIFGYAKGSNSGDSSAKVTLNISNVISCGRITNSKDYAANANIGHVGLIDGTTELNLTNVYYKAFDPEKIAGGAPMLASGTANSSTNVAALTDAQMGELTASDFADGSKWGFKAASAPDYYLPCPVPFADDANWPAKLSKTIVMTVSAEHRDTADKYEGIRFVATFDVLSFCTDGGTLSANFGVILISKPNYDNAADTTTVAGLIAADALQVKAVKYREVDGKYTVNVVLYNLAETMGDVEIVAIPYLGDTLGTPITAVYNTVAGVAP